MYYGFGYIIYVVLPIMITGKQVLRDFTKEKFRKSIKFHVKQ